jgi:hypothetical protein
MTNENVIKRIELAFNSVSMPSAKDIVYGGSWQDDEILSWLDEHGYKVDDEFIEAFADCLPNFTRESMLYFLSRYMIYAMKYPDTNVIDHVVSKISRIGESGNGVSDFNFEQRIAVRRFLIRAKRAYIEIGGSVYSKMIDTQLAKEGPWRLE